MSNFNSYFPQMYPQVQVQQPQNEIKYVQGEAGAKSYLVAPNQTVVLFDTESNVIYLKSADQVGMPSMKVLEYTVRGVQNSPESDFVTKDELSLIKEEIEALKGEMKVKGGKSK